MRVDGGSNVTLVTYSSLFHNAKQTNNKIGNTGEGTAKTTHTEDLSMMLATDNEKILLNMK